MKNAQLKLCLTILLSALLVGCFENKRDTKQLCAATPELRCDELNINDGQCRITRTDLIWHRRTVLRDPSDVNKIKEYQLTQEYRLCMEVAAQLQPIDKPLMKQRRFESLVNAGNNLDRISNELHQFRTPEALYFLWSQNNDKDARREFLQMERSPELQTARLQYALATFYTDVDQNKTLKLLNRALELTSGPKQLNTEILESLASINQLINQKERSYIWAMVAKEFNVPIVDQDQLALLYHFDDTKMDQLNEIVSDVISAINKGKYRSDIIPDPIN
ncbi:DUF2989 domain-containing protein [Vibrio sp. WJH972]